MKRYCLFVPTILLLISLFSCSQEGAHTSSSMSLQEAVEKSNLIIIAAIEHNQVADVKMPASERRLQYAHFSVGKVLLGQCNKKKLKLSFAYDEKIDIVPRKNEKIIVFIEETSTGDGINKIISASEKHIKNTKKQIKKLAAVPKGQKTHP